MNFNLDDFTPIPKESARRSGTLEKGRIVAIIRQVKNRPGYISIYVGVEKSVVNQNVKYEPCVAPNCNNAIVLKPASTGGRFTRGSKSEQILRVTFDRKIEFLPSLIAQEFQNAKNKRIYLKTKHEGDVYILYVDNQMILFNN